MRRHHSRIHVNAVETSSCPSRCKESASEEQDEVSRIVVHSKDNRRRALMLVTKQHHSCPAGGISKSRTSGYLRNSFRKLFTSTNGNLALNEENDVSGKFKGMDKDEFVDEGLDEDKVDDDDDDDKEVNEMITMTGEGQTVMVPPISRWELMTANARHSAVSSTRRLKSYHSSWSHHHLTNMGEEKAHDDNGVVRTERQFFQTSCNIIYEDDDDDDEHYYVYDEYDDGEECSNNSQENSDSFDDDEFAMHVLCNELYLSSD